MASYRYIKKSSPETPVKLSEVEEVAARALGEEPILTGPGACVHEDVVAEVGFAFLMKNGGGSIDDWTPGGASVLLKADAPAELAKKIHLMVDTVFGAYRFEAWR